MIRQLLLLTAVIGIKAGNEVWISPPVVSVPFEGGGFMQCSYNDAIENVHWLDPNGNPITSDTEDVTLEVRAGKLLISFQKMGYDRDGKYTCQGTSKATNQTVSEMKQVTVYDPISWPGFEAKQNFEQGTDARVKCEPSGTPTPEVTWQQDSTPIKPNPSARVYTDEVSGDLVINNISKADEGTYLCMARQINQGKDDKKSIFVDVEFAPAGIQVPALVSGTKGEGNLTITCDSVAEPEPEFKWYRGGIDAVLEANRITENLSGNGRNLTLVNPDEKDSGDYTCVASNNRGQQLNTTKVVIMVKPTFTSVKNASVEEGETATISCVSYSVPATDVKIYKGDTLVESGGLNAPSRVMVNYLIKNEASVTFDPATADDNGEYKCEAVNRVGFADAVVTLDVQYAPKEPVLPEVYTCLGQPAQLACAFMANPAPALAWGRMSAGALDAEETTTVDPVTSPSNGSLDAGVSKLFTDINFGASTNAPAEKNTSKGGFVEVQDSDNVMLVQKGGVTLLKIMSVKSESLGKYSCKAENDLGSKEAVTELKLATVPGMPLNLKVRKVTTRGATVSFAAPENVTVPITSYLVEAKALDGSSSFDNLLPADGDLRYVFTSLQHNTEYTVLVSGENCQGKGQVAMSRTFTTKLITKPKNARITTSGVSSEPYAYELKWKMGGTGGGQISQVQVKYWPSSNSNATAADAMVLTFKPTDQEFMDSLANLDDLEPDTTYSVELIVRNEVGEATSSFLFTTPKVRLLGHPGEHKEIENSLPDAKPPAVTTRVPQLWTVATSAAIFAVKFDGHLQQSSSSPTSVDTVRRKTLAAAENVTENTLRRIAAKLFPRRSDAEMVETTTAMMDRNPSSGASNALIIAIIIAAAILLLLIIDISCCIARKCGLIHCIYVHTCGSSSKDSMTVTEKGAEEGSAEFRRGKEGNYRKDSKGDEVAEVATASCDKLPLTDEAEPIANGSQQERGIVNEETPLNQGAEEPANEKPVSASAPLMQNEQPTPANSPMEGNGTAEKKESLKAEDVEIAVNNAEQPAKPEDKADPVA